jgi:DHA1 family bicyclomycin/chloramphenicol resistance-like MFS transporter
MPKLRGTASSAQAFVQMMFSTVSAGLVIPLLWHSPLGLACGMFCYLLIGVLCVKNSSVWKLKMPK